MTSPTLGAWLAARYPDHPPLPLGGVLGDLCPDAGEEWSADLVGVVYERSLAPTARRAAGAFYTPPAIADGVVRLALPDGVSADRVLDPAVGGGAFLLAVARRLEAFGLDRRVIVERHLFGVDVDADALEATAVALALWAGPDARGWADPRPHLRMADTLAVPPDALLDRFGVVGFDAVVGNPPFLGQLRRGTVRARTQAAQVEAAYPGAGGAYTDAAALFLLAAIRLVRPGGRTALLAPESVLVARDAAGVRSALLDGATLEHVWVAGEQVFTAATRVCCPVLRRGDSAPPAGPRAVGRSTGVGFRPAPAGAAPEPGVPWGHLVAGLHGVPTVDLGEGPILGDRATTTAGFRQQYYGIRPFVVDGSADDRDDGRPRLVTSGSIDPLVCRWGQQPITFARSRWTHPRVDVDALSAHDPTLHRWAVGQLRPKVVVATQTRIVEAAADVDGCWYPSTPTVSVVPDDGRLWELLAVLCAPPVSAWLHARLAGSALAAGYLRITARAVREVPWPPDGDALRQGAALAVSASALDDAGERRAGLLELGRVMTAAYGAAEDVYDWWAARLPPVGSDR